MQVIHPSHRLYAKDNMIKRFKSYIFKFIYDIINKHLISKSLILKRLSYRLVCNLNKKFNERLLKMKISDIIYEQKDNIILDDYNRKIIDRIYEEKKERNVIKILELTFEELFIIFRRKLNDSEDLKKLEKIKNKIKGLDLLENDNYKDIQYFIDKVIKKKYHERDEQDEYIKKFKSLCLTYQNWFNERKGRASRKKMSNYL